MGPQGTASGAAVVERGALSKESEVAVDGKGMFWLPPVGIFDGDGDNNVLNGAAEAIVWLLSHGIVDGDDGGENVLTGCSDEPESCQYIKYSSLSFLDGCDI